jgi:uncharacterized surface protein with fasciclin (FAS1) repeats
MAAAPDVVDAAVSTPDLSTLVAALEAAGLVDVLKSPGPFTIFAPTNAAFANLPAGTLDSLLKPENKQKLITVLSYHVVPRYVKHRSLIEQTQDLPTLAGRMIRTAGNMAVTVNGARVLQPEILASNGVIHRIDAVLLPKM